MKILFFIFAIYGFVYIRWLLSFRWNKKLAIKARENAQAGKNATFYLIYYNMGGAVINPLCWHLWTTKRWEKYLLNKVEKEVIK